MRDHRCSAERAQDQANCFPAMVLSYSNAMANIRKRTHVGEEFLHAGLGCGGTCSLQYRCPRFHRTRGQRLRVRCSLS